MITKTKIVIAVALLAGVFATGRFTAPVKIETKTVTVEKIVEKTITDTKKDTTTTETDNKDGSKTIVTVVNENTQTKTKETDDKSSKTDTITTYVSNRNNISILAGLQPHLTGGISAGPIVYGASITHALLGPITVGAWALSNYTVGASIGINF